MNKFTTHCWAPISNLPDSWKGSLCNPQTAALVKAWQEQAEELEQQHLYTTFLTELRRKWAIETGVIEGAYTLSEGATKTLIEKGLDASLISHNDTDDSPEIVIAKIQDHHHAIMGLDQFISGPRELGTSYVKELHQILMKHQNTYAARDSLGNDVIRELPKGEWKKLKNNVEHDDGTVFEYCPPEHVGQEMDNLISMFRRHEAENVPADIEAAWLHHRFTLIHPFTDGNGRVARCLATLVLLKAYWLPLVITRTDRDVYIAALRAADQGDLKPLVDLFGLLQRKAIREALSLSEQVEQQATAIQGVLEQVKQKIEHRKKGESERVKQASQTADSLQLLASQRLGKVCDEVLDFMRTVDKTIAIYEYNAPRDSEKTNYHYHQIIDCAKTLGYFADLSRYQAWAALAIVPQQWSDTDQQRPDVSQQRSEILFSFHGIGHVKSGVLGCSAMFFTKRKTEDNETIIRDLKPLAEEPFEFTHFENSTDVQQRFRMWLDESVLLGLQEWQASI